MKSFPLAGSGSLLLAFIFLCSPGAKAQTNLVPPRVTQPVSMDRLVTLRGNVHPLARPEFDQGVAPDDLPMERMLLVLQRAPAQEAALRQLLDDQQVKSSARYHQWVTPEQFGRQFGPAEADVQAVTDWLAAQGFQVAGVSAGRTVVEFSGTAGLVRQALGTEIHRFTLDGKDYWANVSDPQIPAALAPVVAGFASLNNLPREMGRPVTNAYVRSKDTVQVHPLFTVTSNNTNYYAVGPTDFATIYNVLPLWTAGIDGSGQTIAVLSDTNIHLGDPDAFRSLFGLPYHEPQVTLNGPDPGITDDEIEADLDVEWAGAVAKGATINLVVSQTTETTWGVDLSALYVIDNNLAPIMSVSYGECEQFLGVGGNAFYYATREQGAAEGITIINSSGDAGSARCDQASKQVAAQHGLAVSGLASTPFNVAVGGTDFGDVGYWSQYWNSTNATGTYASAKSYIPETTWNASCAASGNCGTAASDTPTGIDLLAGGGGPSTCGIMTGTDPNATCVSGYPKPAWQTGAGVPQDGVRDIPDVSLFASSGTNNSFYAFCSLDALPAGSVSCMPWSGSWSFSGAGGTSFAAPSFAGIMALVVQKTGQRQGNANYVLYPLAAQPGATCTSNAAAVSNSNCIFYDVVNGNNSVACVAGSKNCSNQSGSGYGILVNPADNSTPAWTAGAGYDLATGLGSMNVANLVNKWNSVSFTPTTTTLSPFPANITHGQPVSFTVNVTSGSGTPTGDVSLIAQVSQVHSIGIGSFTLGNDGTVTATTNMLPGGTYNVVAHYAGDGTHGASDSTPQPVTVSEEGSQTTIGLSWCDYNSGVCTPGVTNLTYGASYGQFILRMDVTNSSGQPCASPATGLVAYPCPTGNVIAMVNGQPPYDTQIPSTRIAGTYLLNSQGYAVDQFIQLQGGTDNITVSYPGDTSYTTSTSAPLTVNVTKAATTATLTGPTTVQGAYVNLNYKITTQSYGVAPTGIVTAMVNGTNAGQYPVIGTAYSPTTGAYAQAQDSASPKVSPGQLTITMQYSGDNYYLPATSNPITVTVQDYALSANPSSLNIATPGQTASTTLSITPGGGFTGVASLSCTVPQYQGLACSISPSTVNVTGPNAVTALLTVTTTAASAGALRPPRPRIPPAPLPAARGRWILLVFLTLAALLSLIAARRWAAGWVFATALVLALVMAACGGGSGGGGGFSSGGGSSSGPSASLSPSALTFSTQSVTTASAPQTIRLTNSGNAPLAISSIGFTGTDPGDFFQSNDCGGSVVAGVSCVINVTFAPVAAGARSASLQITDNAAGSTQIATLTGTGFSGPGVTLSASSLDFGKVTLGSNSSFQTVTLTNTSTSVVYITSDNFTHGSNPDFDIHSDSCTYATISPGGTCAVILYFSPNTTGLRVASYLFDDNAPNSPQGVIMTGTGVQPITQPGTYNIYVDSATAPSISHQISIPLTVQ